LQQSFFGEKASRAAVMRRHIDLKTIIPAILIQRTRLFKCDMVGLSSVLLTTFDNILTLLSHQICFIRPCTSLGQTTDNSSQTMGFSRQMKSQLDVLSWDIERTPKKEFSFLWLGISTSLSAFTSRVTDDDSRREGNKLKGFTSAGRWSGTCNL
jgi:hypothetical protein